MRRFTPLLAFGLVLLTGIGPRQAPAAGATSGVLFIDQRQLQLDDQPGRTATVTVLNTPARLEITGVDWRPLLTGAIRIEPATLPEAHGPAITRQLGYVSGPDGEHLAVKRDRGTVWVEGVEHARRYTGTVDLTPGVGSGETVITLSVRHAIVYPLAVLLLVGGLLLWRERRSLPRSRAGLAAALAIVVLVALTGLFVLYVPNPAFHSASDYLGVALWGVVVGEATQAVRRFLLMPAPAPTG